MHQVQYAVEPDRVEENERLVRAVFDELRASRPPGLRYACLRQAGGSTFIHLVAHESRGSRMTDFPAFRLFSSTLAERCSQPPRRVDLHLIGAYDLFDRE